MSTFHHQLNWNGSPHCLFLYSFVALRPQHARDIIRKHPQSVVVTEGQWANFSCGIKLPGSIKWRIGDFKTYGIYDYNSGESLPELEGVTAERSFPPEITGNVLTETIGVLAAPDLHGVLIKCMYAHPAHVTRRDCYSRSAIIALHPRPTEFDC